MGTIIVLEQRTNLGFNQLVFALTNTDLLAKIIEKARKAAPEIDQAEYVEIMPGSEVPGSEVEPAFFVEYAPQPGSGLLIPSKAGFRNVRFHSERSHHYTAESASEDYGGFLKNLKGYPRDHTLIITGTRERGQAIRKVLEKIGDFQIRIA